MLERESFNGLGSWAKEILFLNFFCEKFDLFVDITWGTWLLHKIDFALSEKNVSSNGLTNSAKALQFFTVTTSLCP